MSPIMLGFLKSLLLFFAGPFSATVCNHSCGVYPNAAAFTWGLVLVAPLAFLPTRRRHLVWLKRWGAFALWCLVWAGSAVPGILNMSM